MKSREIEYQLRTYLPLQSDYFVDWLAVSSYIVSSLVATVSTASAHGLEIGDILHIRDVVFPNVITSLTQTSGIGTAVLTSYTDLTYPYNETITISGATEAAYNGTFNILTIPDRKTVTFQMDATAPASATGSPILEESNLRRYNGLFEIQTVPTTTTFTLTVTGDNFTALAGVEYFNMKDVRIVSEISEERMLETYSKQKIDDWFLWVIPGDGSVSRSKNITSDFDYNYSEGDYFIQQTSENFALHVVIPTQNKITPVDAQDICRNELKKGLIASICGYFPTKLYRNGYEGIFFVAESMSAYNTSYYTHQYNFSTTVNITREDTFIPSSIAIKTIEFNHIDTLEDIKSTDTLNLED